MTGARQKMIEAAGRLLAKDGYRAASFSEVLAASGAPRGSIYHHFPGGKDELVAAAVRTVSDRVLAGLADLDGAAPAAVTAAFLAPWRTLLERGHFAYGCSLLAVTVSAGEGPLREQTGSLFRIHRERLAELLRESGVEPGEAAGFAAELLAATEGAVAVARAEGSLEVFDLTAERLQAQARALKIPGRPAADAAS